MTEATKATLITTTDLGRAMPALDTLKPVLASVYRDRFLSFIGADVWTKDGWLTTSIHGEDAHENIRCQVRQGDLVGMKLIARDQTLYFTPTPQTEFCNF